MNFLNRLAINTAIFDGHDMAESLAMIKALGVSNVEFAFNQGYVGNLDDSLFSDSHADKLIDLLSHYSLSTVALGCTMDMASYQAIESFKMRIIFAEKLGVKYLNTCTTRIEKIDILIDNLNVLAPYAEQHGCVICLENGGDRNFNAISSATESIQLIDKINHKSVALNFDPGNTVSALPDKSPVEEALKAIP
ncbi:sugar phosphate isomerase/epimerase, partial [Photobacterium sp. ZSDE20]|nr:sugar phosphate isomerase/epimerase [Photobacterium sp. ZSDE20]